MKRFPRNSLMLGCAPLGGLYHKTISREQVREVIFAAVIQHGILDIDTAPWYGHGKSETDIGEILTNEDSDNLSSSIRIYTKAGRIIMKRDQVDKNDPRAAFYDTFYAIVPENKDVVPVHDYTAAGIRNSVEGSLKRLRISTTKNTSQNNNNNNNNKATLVEMRLHDCEEEERFVEATTKGGLQELILQCNKYHMKVSLGMNEPDKILRLLRFTEENKQKLLRESVTTTTTQTKSTSSSSSSIFNSILMAGSFNLMDQSGLPVMQYCQEHSIQVHNAGIFGAGLLWGQDKYRYRKATSSAIAKRDAWQEICNELNCSLPAAAFAFAMLPVAVSKIAFGCVTTKELKGSVDAADESMKISVLELITKGMERKLLSEEVGNACLKMLVWYSMKKMMKKSKL